MYLIGRVMIIIIKTSSSFENGAILDRIINYRQLKFSKLTQDLSRTSVLLRLY